MSALFPYVLIDADVLIIDKAYTDDDRHPVNRQFLDLIKSDRLLAGIANQPLFEVVGKLSYQTAQEEIARLHEVTLTKYRLFAIPVIDLSLEATGVTLHEASEFIQKKMSFGDAIMAAQIRKYAASASALITWNAKHFAGKLSIPVMTPAEWLIANPAPTT